MPKPNVPTGPIEFNAEEIQQARAGNFKPLEKRLKKHASAQAPLAAIASRPRSMADLKKLMSKARG